jgi:hypothetical protein
MPIRTALLGPFQSLRVNAIDQAANVEPFIKELPRLEVPTLWYACTLQAGIERLDITTLDLPENVGPPELRKFLKKHDILPPVLSKRIIHVNTPEATSIFLRIQFCFQNYLRLQPTTVSKNSSVTNLQAFLVELLLAAQRKQNLIYFDRLPDIASLEPILPVDFLLPFKNLLNAIERSATTVPTVRGSLSVQDINLFEELIVGNAFCRYEQRHAIIDHSKVPLRRGLQILEKQTRSLIIQNPHLLKVKRAIISILPISSKIIDTVFGKLPGDLAGIFTSLLSKWLDDSRRVVIYEFPDLVELTMRSRIKELAAKSNRDGARQK